LHNDITRHTLIFAPSLYLRILSQHFTPTQPMAPRARIQEEIVVLANAVVVQLEQHLRDVT
jgi:hypothetical protein